MLRQGRRIQPGGGGPLTMSRCFCIFTRSFTFYCGFLDLSFLLCFLLSMCRNAAPNTCILLEAVGASFCIVLAPWRTPKHTVNKELSLFAITLLRWSRGIAE